MADVDPTRLSLSEELREVIEEAEDIAHAAGQVPGSVHLLLAFFTSRTRVERFLRERSVDEDRLLDHLGAHRGEPRGAVRAIMVRAAQVAAGCGAEKVDGLHVLVGITRIRESGAYQLLEEAGVPTARLRTRALTILTGGAPRWLARETDLDAPEARARRPHHLSRRPAPHRKLEAGRPEAVAWRPPLLEPPAKPRREPPPRLRSREGRAAGPEAAARPPSGRRAADASKDLRVTPPNAADKPGPSGARTPADAPRAASPGGAADRPGPSGARSPSEAPRREPDTPADGRAGAGRRGADRAPPKTPADASPSAFEARTPGAGAEADAPRREPSAPTAGEGPRRAPAQGTARASRDVEERSPAWPERAAPARPPAATRRAPAGSPTPASEPRRRLDDPGAAWRLPEEDFPWLTSLGRNLSVEAARGELDVLVGREPEVEQLVDILGKRRANNPCLVGEPGVGKTAIVEGLAARWAVGSPEERAKIVIGLDAGRLLVGTHLRGSFSEKLRGLQDEVKRAEGKVLVFFDELHTLVGAGAAGEGALDAAGELKAALARGDFPCMGASTPEEFERHVARDPALERRFVPVRVEEPHPDQAEAMLFRILPAYAAHHGVGFTPEAVRASVRLSMRFIPEQRLPDKAIALLDLAGSRAARAGLDEVDAREVARLVAERTGVPLERLLRTDRERLLDLEGALGRRVVGHRRSLERIAEVIRRHAAGFGSHRPLGVFLLVGPSGVGKTETAKALAEILHEGDPGALVRFDLSEFSEAHAVARLVGAPPGYVGHDSGGQLTEAVRRRPGRVVLLDEIEKAHREVLQVLLSILDEGRLTDARGRTVSFAESVIILTSNLGSELASPRSRKVGFASTQAPSPSAETAVLEAARRALAPELWGRIDEKLYYPPLERGEVRRIARLLVAESSARLERERGIAFDVDARAIDALIEQGGVDAQLGARPLRRVLGHLVEGPIAARVLEGRLHAGERVTVTRRDGGGLLFRVGEDGASLSQRPTRRHVP